MALTKVDVSNIVTGILPVANGGTGTSTGVAPGGSTTQVQYNNAGAFGGDSGFVYSGGSVGIGTASPTTKLDVRGSGYFINSSNPTSFWSVDSSLTTGSGYCQWNTSSNEFRVESYTNHPLVFGTNNTERMRIDSSGNVGIGTTTPTAFAGFSPILDLKGTAPAIAFHDTTASAINFTIAANSNQMDFYNDSTSTSLMSLLSSGNVGIGTTNPVAKLEVSSSSAGVTAGDLVVDTANKIVYVGRLSSTGGDNAKLVVRNRVGDALTITGDTTADGTGLFRPGTNILGFTSNSSEKARISAAGGFSVGTTADPGAGAIYATGNITAYYSDDRLKTKLGGIENALDKVKSLSGFYYEANQTAQDLGYQAVREVGVSAQQVQAVMPEVVKPAPIDQQYLTVDYERLVPLLIEAIKELEEKVAKLEAK